MYFTRQVNSRSRFTIEYQWYFSLKIIKLKTFQQKVKAAYNDHETSPIFKKKIIDREFNVIPHGCIA